MLHPSKKFIGVETLKAYNPSTAHRRKERVAEKKKNKAERKVTREQVLLKKNPVAIKEELDKLEAMAKAGQPMSDGRSRRLLKLQQLWAQVVSAVEAERRVRTADVSSIAAAESTGTKASPFYSKCLQQRLSHGERAPEEDERRYYCPELCNTGIFRHPDGSIRPYPPLVANDRSEQRRKFVESQQRQNRDRRGMQSESDASSDSASDDESPSNAAGGSSSSRKKPAEAGEASGAAEDFLASIPLPSEPPPEGASAAVAQAAEKPTTAMPMPMPFFPMPFPVPPVGAYGGATPQQAATSAQGCFVPLMGPQAAGGSAPFLPPTFMPPFPGIPAPPPQLLAQMHQQMPAPPQQAQHQQRVPPPPMQQSPAPPAAPPSDQKKPTVLRVSQPPAKKPQTATKPQPATKPADGADFKAAMAFVPTHLRTKKLPATAKAQEGPSISRVSAYSMGTGALGRQGGSVGGSGDGEATSGLARFLGETRKQAGDGATRAPQKAGPADLDRAFDEFLKEVGAA